MSVVLSPLPWGSLRAWGLRASESFPHPQPAVEGSLVFLWDTGGSLELIRQERKHIGPFPVRWGSKRPLGGLGQVGEHLRAFLSSSQGGWRWGGPWHWLSPREQSPSRPALTFQVFQASERGLGHLCMQDIKGSPRPQHPHGSSWRTSERSPAAWRCPCCPAPGTVQVAAHPATSPPLAAILSHVCGARGPFGSWRRCLPRRPLRLRAGDRSSVVCYVGAQFLT